MMTEDILLAHVKHACQTCRTNRAVLWYAPSFDDSLHLQRLGALERTLDVCVGSMVNIDGTVWHLCERKCTDQPGIVVYLERKYPPAQPTIDPQPGMIVENRPKTAQEWKAYGIQHALEKGIPLRTPVYPQAQAKGGRS